MPSSLAAPTRDRPASFRFRMSLCDGIFFAMLSKYQKSNATGRQGKYQWIDIFVDNGNW
jgi:hypothetical protein